MANKKRPYIKRYYTFQTIGIITVVLSILQWCGIITVFAVIALYNAMCGGMNCDGSTCMSCTPTEMPDLFVGLMLWMMEVIAMTGICIWSFVQMNQNKIPEDDEEENAEENV